MIEDSQNKLELKKRLRSFAAWYAFWVPIACVILSFVAFRFSVTGWFYGPAALVFISSLTMGVLSLFGSSVQGVRRGLVLIGISISGICGGITLFLFIIGQIAHGFV